MSDVTIVGVYGQFYEGKENESYYSVRIDMIFVSAFYYVKFCSVLCVCFI